MRRDKTGAQIFLVLSAVHIALALAAPTGVRQRHLDVTEDVAVAWEKRSNLGNTQNPDMMPEVGSGSGGPANSPKPVLDPSHHSWEPTDFGSDRYHPALDQLDDPEWSSGAWGSTSSYHGAPPSHNNPTPEPGTLPWHDNSRPESGTPQLHDNPQPESGASPSHENPTPESGALPLHDNPPPEPGAPQLHENPPPESGAPMHQEAIFGHPKLLHDVASKAAPEAEKFFNDELMAKIKDYAILGTVAGISTGIITATQKEIMGTISPGAYVSALFPPFLADIQPGHKCSDL